MATETNFKLIVADNKETIGEFLNFPVGLYKSDKNWIRPLDKDVEAVFDPKKNKLLRNGEAIRWLLKDETGNCIGRIAVFYNATTAKVNEQLTGGIGFFECVNNREAAFALFDAAKTWLTNKGMEAMDGPVNFGERDSFWGCLVDGFHEPVFNMPYNFPYYKDFFEEYGFQNYFNQYTYHRKISAEGLDPVIKEKAERIFRNPDYTFKMITWKHNERFADDFVVIFNKAWARFPGIKKIGKVHAMALLKALRPVMDTRLVYFAYHLGEPIAFFIMMPDIFQIIRKFDGKMNWINKLRFLYYLRVKKTCNRIIGRIFGIIPEFQGRGIESALILAFGKEALKPGFPYTDLELNWIGDFNPTMMKMCEQIGGRIYKTHVTYRHLFDREKEFKRSKKVS
jgi:GNAT superfamily N-acetyltransferase